MSVAKHKPGVLADWPCVSVVCPRYLKATGQSETLPDFKAKMDGVLLDEAVIKAAIQQDKAKESQQRASAQRSKA